MTENRETWECGQTKYLMNSLVVIEKLYPIVGLVKICYVGEETPFVIDIRAISDYPDTTKTISLSLLGGQK